MIPAQLGAAPDIVYVGGGPIGLWTAIQTRILTGKNITVLEKHPAYQRANIRLNIKSYSLGGIPDDPVLKELVKKWGNRTVPIQKIESALAQRAEELGISILRGYEADPNQLAQEFRTAKVFVGADGARSVFRREIFGDEFRFNSTLQHIVQVQYKVGKMPEEQDNSIQKVRDLAEQYKMQKFAGHLISQTIRPQEDGTSHVTLQIFIDKALFKEMVDATFRHPYYFETDLERVPLPLKEVLIKWWGAREKFHGEKITRDEEANKLTVIALNSYASKDVAKIDSEGRVWTLVGDSAAAFPYFRAINNGFLMGTKLAKSIAVGFKSDFKSPLKSYSRYTTFRITIERIRALVKNLIINLGKLFIKLSGTVFWQTVKLKQGEKVDCYERGTRIWEELEQRVEEAAI